MDNEFAIPQQTRVWLTDGVFKSSYQAYSSYLIGRGYSSWSVRKYLGSVAHFAHWLRKRRVTLGQIDEALVRRFLDDHLPRCDCPSRTPRCRNHVGPALNRLLVVLRQRADIPPRPDFTPLLIQEELKEFDAHLDQVCGLAASTRRLRTRIVRIFLSERFGASRINMAQVKPEHVHRFVVRHLQGCKPSTGKVLGIALRSYLRFRGMHGDHVRCLIAAIPQIAQWRLASLPDTLSEAELERFLNAFDRQSAIGRRDCAMARCMVDLGLRAGEVASLQLDDLNWHDGTLRLSAGKARRTDVLPLPTRTGRAIAQYLTDGRPVSDSRAAFDTSPPAIIVVAKADFPIFAHHGTNPRRQAELGEALGWDRVQLEAAQAQFQTVEDELSAVHALQRIVIKAVDAKVISPPVRCNRSIADYVDGNDSFCLCWRTNFGISYDEEVIAESFADELDAGTTSPVNDALSFLATDRLEEGKWILCSGRRPPREKLTDAASRTGCTCTG